MSPHAYVPVDGAAACQDPDQPLNIVIPIGGIGSRFAKHGFRYPKPLINLVGRPMLVWLLENLHFRPGDTVWVAVNQEIDDDFHLGQLVRKTLPGINHRILRLRHQTKGASETLYIASQSMTSEHLQRKTVSLDCDTVYWADILSQVRHLPPRHGACFYFPDHGDKPVFSYIETEPRNGLDYITDVQEKKAISDKANSGAYVFPSGLQLKAAAAEVLDMRHPDDQIIGEYYTSKLVQHMIRKGTPFAGVGIQEDDFTCVGTPQQLQDFLMNIKIGKCKLPIKSQRRRFCFDLDGTLVGVPAVLGDYSTCPPIDKNIRLLQQLFEAGHYIIIQTARRMRTHNGNVGSVIADIGAVTFAQLARYSIPFHEINFGKPFAHVYIDDLAVNANIDTTREIGWLLDGPTSLTPAAPELEFKLATEQKIKNSMVAARDFNTIQILDGKVVKSSKTEHILGELFFYSHMPPEVAIYFPSIYSVDFLPPTSTYIITMENCGGLTFSHLLVGRSITTGRFEHLLKALHSIHSSQGTSQRSLRISSELESRFNKHTLPSADRRPNIYANYGSKLRRRYSEYRALYNVLGPRAALIFSRLCEFLDRYEAEDRGGFAHVIHGDPVFSNAILRDSQKTVSFIDVRCQLGDTLTPEGDVNYDLAKVLQSLCGYDHVLFLAESPDRVDDIITNQKPLLDQADSNLLEHLQRHFFTFLAKNYPAPVDRETLLRITASLLFSLIPLHKPEMGALFLRLCQETLEKADDACLEERKDLP
ncbi:mobA-like NTP transferase domain-containing protein [Hirsutella rhossiliensis]|uniref:Mannose-1-phosphate guanyltransferase n=1 Tax=Hirsutella rhossiliensis TaxID=111463 RepID=A0A9P8MT65_9HYPO|nr:mobA-like NTP transferase domain-containing protein [Hirsutella rhossiliensis]KAH0961523.1 mobA-like NTP transferase domain-containing protein [Hirsutella rhossiliensis]